MPVQSVFCVIWVNVESIDGNFLSSQKCLYISKNSSNTFITVVYRKENVREKYLTAYPSYRF